MAYATEEERKAAAKESRRRYYLKTRKLKGRTKIVRPDLLKYERTEGWMSRYQMWKQAKWRAKERGLAFDLEYEDIVVPETCPVLGIPILYDQGRNNHHSPSLDRKDNDGGYTKDNVQVISLRANTLKKDANLEEIRKILRYMEEST